MNVISITDGQIYLDKDLFYSGIRPAIDVGMSVSRVGGHAQVEAMKKVAAKLRLDLAAHRELQDFARMGTELDSVAQAQLDRGNRMVELLKQTCFAPMSTGLQVITIYLGSVGMLDDLTPKAVSGFIADFLNWLNWQHPDYIEEIDKSGKFSDELAAKIKEAVNAFKAKNKTSLALTGESRRAGVVQQWHK
jgi:F-type H+-transporting ATPase subunit alpha